MDDRQHGLASAPKLDAIPDETLRHISSSLPLGCDRGSLSRVCWETAHPIGLADIFGGRPHFQLDTRHYFASRRIRQMIPRQVEALEQQADIAGRQRWYALLISTTQERALFLRFTKHSLSSSTQGSCA